MKQLLTIILVLISGSVFSHPSSDIEYAIVFGDCFEKAVISLKINNKPIFENYRLGFEQAGNLGLKQTEKGIDVFYNGKEKHHSKIKVEHLVNLSITVNDRSENFVLDLRKGNILMFNFCSDKQDAKKLSIEQRQEALILM